MGAKREGKDWWPGRKIAQLIVSLGLVWREARHRAQKATIPSKGI
jgi:hypothetical protein